MRTFRRLAPFESWRIKQHFLRLSPEDRQLRFCGAVGDGFIANHVDGLDWNHAILVGYFDGGTLRGVGEMCLERTGGRAEAAITVEEGWRGGHVGTELLRYLITIAGNRAMRTIYMICLLDNHRIQHIARKFTDRLVIREDEAEADLKVPFPTQLSLWEEAATETLGAVTTWLEAGPVGTFLKAAIPQGRKAA